MAITIGSDPEFLVTLRDTNDVLGAREFLSYGGEIGCDGHATTGELRPPCAETPIAHTDIISRSLAGLEHKLRHHLRERGLSRENYTIIGGSGFNTNPVGGHIHFGMESSSDFVRALDCYLALPIMFLEDVERSSYRRRRGGAYGKLGAYERKRYGFEYRPLPSWLTARRFTAASLCIAHMIADAAYKDVLPPPIDFPSDSFYACDKGALYPFLDRVYAGWRSMPRWAEYSTYISVIPQEIKLKRDWKENWDLIRRWDLPTSDDDLLRMWQDNVNSRRVKDTGCGPVADAEVPEQDFPVDEVVYNPSEDDLLYNGNDTGCREIARIVFRRLGTNADVYIYGLNANREVSIAYYSGALPENVRQNYTYTRRAFGAALNHTRAIGFSPVMRSEPGRCAQIAIDYIEMNGWG